MKVGFSHASRVAARSVLMLGFVVCLAATLSGCKNDTPADPKPNELSASTIRGANFNVLLISMDTTRADSLGCYGHPQVKTPNIDQLASAGTRFEQCISSAPITLPSHATMLTGSQPFVHGARDNGQFIVGEKNVSIAEILRDAGYTTHAEVGAAVLDREYGLDQGFETYGDLKLRTSGAQNAADTDIVGEVETKPQDDSLWSKFDRKADAITHDGLALLDRFRDERFFIFLHYYDPHQPYTAPEPYSSAYDDGYLAEIAFTDAQIGHVLDKLRELELDRKTLVILTSDHGEGRGQHGEQTHSYFVYDATLHVPLIIACPGTLPAGRVVASQVRLLDLAPTILEFVGLGDKLTPQMEGTSLLPVLERPDGDLHLPAYGESLAPQLTFSYSPLRSLRSDGWKYIHAPEPELYHVSDDPLELFELSETQPERVAEMSERLYNMIADAPAPPDRRLAVQAADPEAVRRLQALGYVGADAAALAEASEGSEIDNFEPHGVSPRRRIEPIELCNLALGELLSGNYAAAEKLYRRLAELEPENGRVTRELADAVEGQGRIEEAEELYRRAIKLNPADAAARLRLANSVFKRGDYAAAAQEYRACVESDPTNFIPHMRLADSLAAQQKWDEAFVEYDAAAALAPDVGTIPYQYGRGLRAAGRLKEAEAKFRKACELSPDLLYAHLDLTLLLRAQGRRAEGIHVLTEYVTRQPDAGALGLLARMTLDEGDATTAARYFEQAGKLHGDTAVGHYQRGLGHAVAGDLKQACDEFTRSVEMEPEYIPALQELSQVLSQLGQTDAALKVHDRLVALKPPIGSVYRSAADMFDANRGRAAAIEVLKQGVAVCPAAPLLANDLAWRLATSSDANLRDGAEAVRLAQIAVSATDSDDPSMLDTLAAAYAEAGRFDEAVASARQALALARKAERTQLSVSIERRLGLYEQQRPFHDE